MAAVPSPFCAVAALALAMSLGGCAGIGERAPEGRPVLHDAAFGAPAAPAVSSEDLFRLPGGLVQKLRDPQLQALPSAQRLDRLMTLIFGPDKKGFSYAAGHSTSAAETWAARRGDCLSLTLLTYAAAKSLGLEAHMQEVRVPAVYQRRGTFDFVNRHVNVVVRVRNRDQLEEVLQPQDVVIDFEPEFARAVRGRVLDDQAVLARYYNNLGAESLARRQDGAAYAAFKAALAADPRHAAPYGNLAVLYRERGFKRDAELLLRQGIAAGDEPDVALASLHDLLNELGRTAEARAVAAQLLARQEADPYHWIARGVQLLAEGRDRQAIESLERAEGLTSGFGEVHGWLALAYWRAGEKNRAGEQLALLEALQVDGGTVSAKLRRKFSSARP